MNRTAWCQSGDVPITVGTYLLRDGTEVNVKQSRTGRFYACGPDGEYQPGLIYRLRAELDSGEASVRDLT